MDDSRTFVEGPGGAWRELPAGTMVGDYRIEGLLGRGGMGAVYVAEHTRMGKRFALKVLPPEVGGDRRFRERFDEEARRMASLEHPHIVKIYNAGESSGLHYFAMELLDGDLEEKRKAESCRRRKCGKSCGRCWRPWCMRTARE